MRNATTSSTGRSTPPRSRRMRADSRSGFPTSDIASSCVHVPPCAATSSCSAAIQ
ncbi:Uncharacterised protein [Mycobacteroides abscessus]|nr:Uncharacterised protein [Mycobacteroides abscessus]